MRSFRRTIQAAVGFILVVLAVSPPAGEAAPSTDWPLLVAGDARRGESVQPGRSDRLVLQVAEPGIVALAVAAPGREPLAPELALDPTPVTPAAGPPALIAERTVSSLLVLVHTPGAYRVWVMPRDPLLALGSYRLESSFAPFADPSLLEAGVNSVHAADGTGGEGEEEEEEIEEIDGRPINQSPDPLMDPEEGIQHIGAASGTDGGGLFSLQLDAGGDLRRIGVLHLCRGEAVDDHGDIPHCATGLDVRKAVAGSLDNAHGDDHDYFTFEVYAPVRVQVESFGDADTLGGLYDARGRRLAVDDDGGTGGNFRIRALLGAGRYFVRVEGAEAAEGEYRVAFRHLIP